MFLRGMKGAEIVFQRWATFVRWPLALTFPIGYMVTLYFFHDYTIEYFLFTVIAFLACLFLLSVLNGPFILRFPIWLLLLVFLIVYYMKFYLIILRPDLVRLLPMQVYTHIVSDEVLIRTYATTTWAFVAFSGAAWMFRSTRRSFWSRQEQRKPTKLSMGLAVGGAMVLITASSLFVYATDMIMGGLGQELPFRLGGMVAYLRIITIPVMLVLIMWGTSGAMQRGSAMGAVLLAVHGISDMVLRTSKGTLFFALIAAGFLWLLQGKKIRSHHVMLGLIAGVLVLFLYPFAMDLRFVLRSNYAYNLSTAVSIAFLMRVGQPSLANLFSTLTTALEYIVMRLSGSDILAALVAHDAEAVGWRIWDVLTGPHGFAGHLTVDVFGGPAELVGASALAPSLVGFFYVVGGDLVVFLGMGIMTIAVLWFWEKLAVSNLRSRVVAQVSMLNIVLMMAVDGLLDRAIVYKLPVFAASVFLCECIIRLGDARCMKGGKDPNSC